MIPQTSLAGLQDQTDDGLFADLAAKIGELVERGDSAAVDALIDDHPAHAERLRRVRPAIEALAALDDCDNSMTGGDAARQTMAGRPTLGDFRIIRELGRGGMGVVYEAEQLSLARRVALKVLPFAAMLEERQLARFKNEARAAASLHHPHIVPVHYVGVERGVHFYAMQYIEGQTLAEAIAAPIPPPLKGGVRGGIPGVAIEATQLKASPSAPSSRPEGPERDAALNATPDTAPYLPAGETVANAGAATLRDPDSPAHFRRIAELGVQAAKALHYAHESGVIHRDVKPSNLLVDDSGHLWIADFGLARIGASPTLTMTGDLVGTLRYMSPEQLRGKAAMLDHRTDVYSLGVTLYELLTHRPAFAADNSEVLLRRILEEEPVAPRSINKSIPIDLETIIQKAVRKDAEARYSTAKDLADDLRRFLHARPIEARPVTLLERTRKWSRRHAALLGLGMAAFAIVAAVATAASLLTLGAYRSESRQRLAAEANLLLAADSIDQMLSRLAEDRKAHGDIDRASTLAIDAAEFYERLLRRGTHPDLVYRAADAYKQVGVIWALIGRYEKAADAHRRGKELLAPLAESSRRNEHQIALAQNYLSRAEAEWSLRQFDAAEDLWRSALAIYEQLARRSPNNVDFDIAVAGTLNNIALAAMNAQRLDEAELLFARCTAIEAALPAELKAAPTYWESHGMTLNNWGLLALQRGEPDRAIKLFEDSIALQRQAFKAWNAEPTQHHCYRSAHFNIAMANAEAGRHASAAQALDRLITACPEYLDMHLASIQLLLEIAKPLEDAQAAAAYKARARELVAKASAASVVDSDASERFARFLVMCDDESFRDPAAALERAEAIVKAIPERGQAWFTLALARYRNQAWDAAEQALESAVRHAASGRPDASHWLLLAMIRWQQGRTEEARSWCMKATARIARDGTMDDELLLLKTETAHLITSEASESSKSQPAQATQKIGVTR